MIVADNETTVDLLYYEAIARTVVRLVNEKSDEPLTVGVAEEVDAFFNGTWGWRRMVLHYAHLARAAGGVDAFLIGSELRGLTQARSGATAYPAVAALKTLAADVRAILGADVKIGYAADWSEYASHQTGDAVADGGGLEARQRPGNADRPLELSRAGVPDGHGYGGWATGFGRRGLGRLPLVAPGKGEGDEGGIEVRAAEEAGAHRISSGQRPTVGGIISSE